MKQQLVAENNWIAFKTAVNVFLDDGYKVIPETFVIKKTGRAFSENGETTYYTYFTFLEKNNEDVS